MPASPGYSELRTYGCKECGVWVTDRVIFVVRRQGNRYKVCGEFPKASVGPRSRSTGTIVIHGRQQGSFIRIVALAMMLAGTAWQPVRAEDSVTQQASDSGSCARSAFRVLIDVGHTATSPGADSARGVPEYEFNLKLADVIAQSLHEAGFDKTVRLVTSGTRLTVYFSVRRALTICTATCSSPSIMTQCQIT